MSVQKSTDKLIMITPRHSCRYRINQSANCSTKIQLKIWTIPKLDSTHKFCQVRRQSASSRKQFRNSSKLKKKLVNRLPSRNFKNNSKLRLKQFIRKRLRRGINQRLTLKWQLKTEFNLKRKCKNCIFKKILIKLKNGSRSEGKSIGSKKKKRKT